jgi:RimJ/RimL family protein N-acetyltransferase
MEIRCDPLNERSLAVPRKLGYTLDATLRANVRGAGGAMRDTMVWSLLRGEYPASPSAAAEVEAFDAIGRRLL